MKINNETQMVIDFIKFARLPENKDETVFEICFRHNLNEDLVGRGLAKLYKANIISRNMGDKRGRYTRYVYPENIPMGQVLLLLQEFRISDENIKAQVIKTLDEFKL